MFVNHKGGDTSSLSIKHGSYLAIMVLLLILLALVTSICSSVEFATEASFGILLTFALNGCIGVIFLCKSIAEKAFSLCQMHWLFYITMFVVAPMSQYLYNYSPWGYVLSDYDYLVTNVALMIWGLIFALFSRRIAQDSYITLSSSNFFNSLPRLSYRGAIVAVICAVIATLAVVGLVGFGNLFSRGDYSTGLDKTMGLLFDKAIRPIPVFSLIFMIVFIKQRKKTSLLFAVVLVCALIADFPAAMARYNAACLYGGVILLLCAPLFDKKGLFPLLFLLAFLVIFPSANAYRWETFTFSMFFEAIHEVLLNLPKGFCAVDYDAYSILARTIIYVSDFGIENGYQLIGSLLFFIPRSLWPSKPEGSGNLVCLAQGQQQLNISSPFPAEGIINFGIIGLMGFAVVAALVCRYCDRWFLYSRSPIRLFYPVACFLLFFIMRGDLLSSFSFLVGYLVSFSVLCCLCYGVARVFPFVSSEKVKKVVDVNQTCKTRL